jgi:phosphoglycolate phosphatase-like HAD superfamily hydrolase
VLTGGPGQSAAEFADPPELPPVRLPGAADLIAGAEASVLAAQLRTFVRWLGTGRALTGTGRLTLADARELAGLLDVDAPYLATVRSSAELPAVSLVLHWALAARLVRTVKGRLLPVKRAAPLLDRPVELWQRAFAALDELGGHLGGAELPYPGPSLLRWALGDMLAALWLGLYTAGGTPIPVELVHDLVQTTISEEYGFAGASLTEEVERQLWRRDVDTMLDALTTLGAVHCAVSTDPDDRAKIMELSGRADPDTTLVELTPIGLWAVNQQLREQGLSAPAVGELAGASIDAVCGRLRDAAPDVLEAELDAWVRARDADSAAAELDRFLTAATEPWQRLFGLLALTRAGASGVAVGHRIRSGGGLLAAAVTPWLVDCGELDPAAVPEAELVLGLAEHLAALHGLGYLIAELTGRPVAEQVELVRQLGTADHPHRLALLDEIAAEHPDRAVARTARKLRLKLRTAGTPG